MFPHRSRPRSANHARHSAQRQGSDPVITAVLLCGAVLLVPRLRWRLAPLLIAAATAWWCSPLLPLLVVVLFDMAVAGRARAVVGCGVAALAASLLGHPATALWTPGRYASALLLPQLDVVVALWLVGRQRLIQELALDVELCALRGRSRTRTLAAKVYIILDDDISLFTFRGVARSP